VENVYTQTLMYFISLTKKKPLLKQKTSEQVSQPTGDGVRICTNEKTQQHKHTKLPSTCKEEA